MMARQARAHRANGERIAVAMSGGVDSSTAAALLVAQGHDVVGVHLKLHDLPDSERRDKSCCSLDDSLDARQVCSKLEIPFYVLDFTEDFSREVIDYFVSSYQQGRTPNPCVMCNKTVKNALLMQKIREFGCTALATGHYARVQQSPHSGEYELSRPNDRHKDQTYFLFATPREELPSLRFPLADYDKSEARALAHRYNLITWDKPDSQEVCFVPNDYRNFLRQRGVSGQAHAGAFVDLAGRELGAHQGVAYYTVGQRRGLGVSSSGPLYVISLNPERNEVVLGCESALYRNRMSVSGVNWVSCAPPTESLRAVVKVRYAHTGAPASLQPVGAGWQVTFDQPVRAIAPGQAAVFYDGDVLLGGGWIDQSEPEIQ